MADEGASTTTIIATVVGVALVGIIGWMLYKSQKPTIITVPSGGQTKTTEPIATTPNSGDSRGSDYDWEGLFGNIISKGVELGYDYIKNDTGGTTVIVNRDPNQTVIQQSPNEIPN